jgi:FkbM family methyltransferase
MKVGYLLSYSIAFCVAILLLPSSLSARSVRKIPQQKARPSQNSEKPLPQMQETGEKPKLYYRFDLPPECLKIAARYLPSNPVIVDAGAYHGEETCTMAKLWKSGHVHAFEPVKQLFNVVVRTTQNTPNISIYNLALGKECGQTEMFLSTEEGDIDRVSMSSSLLPPKDHVLYCTLQFKKTELVEVTTLDQWAEDYGIEKVDMLWLDMQGYELPALKAAPKVLSTVSVILTELEFVEAYEGQPLYKEVREWLEEQGFVLIAGNFSFPKGRTQWFGDGLFVRKELLSH